MSFFSKLLFIFLFHNISSLLFLIRPGEERCLIDEFLERNYFVVKHKIFTEDRQNLTSLLPNLRFIVKEADNNRIVYASYLINAKDKITQKVEKSGLYKVCIIMNKTVPKPMWQTKIYVNLKITSDNMEKNDFTNAIKSEDINRMQKKADSIIRIINHATEVQKEKLTVEKENSLNTLSNAKMYRYLNIFQIVISAIIGLIQLNNFRRFLKSKHII